MAQLKDLIVTGPARIIGTLYAQDASTTLAGLVKLGGGTTNFLRADGTWAAPPNDKGVTSVAASGSGGITISGSPITSTGTIAIGLNLSTAINGLGEGSSPATMNDYAVVQYAGGGTSTTTYHRRKLSNILTKANIEAGLGYARGAANGVAPLNANSKIDSTYLPSYVDDVLEYTAKANFPATGEEGKIYVDKTTNLTWRWGGSAYVEISPSLALGNTASTAAKGNHTHTVTATGNVTTTTATTANKTATVSAASSGDATYTPAGTNSAPTFTGTAATISVSKSYTPAGSVAAPTFTGTKATGLTVSPASSGTATYTPAGTIAVQTAGSTNNTLKPVTAKTVVTGATFNTVVTSVTKKTVVTGTSVSNEVLSFTTGDSISSTTGASGSATTGDSVTLGSAVTVKTGDAAYSFTGTGKRLVLQDYTPAGTNSAPAFTGTAATITSTGSYTPAGSVSAPTFTGTGARLVTGNIPVPATYTSTFTGTSATTSVPA